MKFELLFSHFGRKQLNHFCTDSDAFFWKLQYGNELYGMVQVLVLCVLAATKSQISKTTAIVARDII